MMSKLFRIDVEELAAMLPAVRVEQTMDLGSVLLQLGHHATYGPVLTVSNVLTEQCAWMLV